jgi:hypothetical protein
MKTFKCITPTKIRINEGLSNTKDIIGYIMSYYQIPASKIHNAYYGGWYYEIEVGDVIYLTSENGYDKTSFEIHIKPNTKGSAFYPRFVREFGNYKNSKWMQDNFEEVN